MGATFDVIKSTSSGEEFTHVAGSWGQKGWAYLVFLLIRVIIYEKLLKLPSLLKYKTTVRRSVKYL